MKASKFVAAALMAAAIGAGLVGGRHAFATGYTLTTLTKFTGDNGQYLYAGVALSPRKS